MHNERGPTPERNEETERFRPVFDIDQMEPRQVAALVTAIGKAWESEKQENDLAQDVSDDHIYSNLLATVVEDLRSSARTSGNAMKIYAHLLSSKSPHSRLAAVDMAQELLNRYLDNPDIARQVIDSWVELFAHDQEGDVRMAAQHAMWKTVYHTDWLDESTKRYLEDQLPTDD